MDPDRWRRIAELFAAAIECEPTERSIVLAAAPELRREVETLLAGHEASGPLDRLGPRIELMRTEVFASAATVSSLALGQCLGRHEIRARLGAGGMGEVYRAFDTRLQREVAIKVLRQRVLARPGALERFENEARAASALNHPNIITVYDLGEDSSLPYIVMELVDGDSLRQVLTGPWPIERILGIATQIADGLVAAHERSIVHRDLKPENVLISRDGVVKIVDFGLAELGIGREDEPGVIQGTFGYLPPEILWGARVDLRSDQFSFGAMLYEMAAGAPAFPGRTSLEMLAALLAGVPPPLAELRADLPPAFLQLVARCLSTAPAERYPSTREVLDELREIRRRAGPALSPAAGRGAHALPARRTRLIGRRAELDQIEHLVAGKHARLVTLTGAGGTGKTRLALEAAERLTPHFPGGAIFVPLAAITDPAVVATCLAQALDVPVSAARSALAGVIAVLRSTKAATLLVLDNFEQVIDAAPVVSDLLAACGDLVVLVTSREVLHLYGEHGFPVPPLELPDPALAADLEALGRCPSVSLFVERAQAANSSFCLTAVNAAAVAALCAGLDGLPLALELAAAHTRVLPPDAMLARFDHRLTLLTAGARDLPGRQQTLRRTIDWSHQLLSPTEQIVFRRLTVFAGGFTVESAQAVVDPYASLGVTLEVGIAALVDKSLLEPRALLDGEPRFVMLETLREYARERLDDSGERDRTQRAHAAYFLVLAEEGAAALAASDHPAWRRRFAVEHDNVRVALAWLIRQGQAEWGLRLALGMFHFWERSEHVTEARRHFDAVLDLEEARSWPALRAKAMFCAAFLASVQGDIQRGTELDMESLQLYRELGDRRGVVVSLVALANQRTCAGDHDRARHLLEDSLEIWQELGDRTGFACSLSNLAFVARQQGRLTDARALYQSAAALFDEIGERLSRAWATDHEGDVAREQGDLAAAEALYAESLAVFRVLGDGWGIASALADLGGVARRHGDHAAAGRLYREALAGFVKLDHRRGIARMLECLACIAADEGRPEHGLELAAAAGALRERLGAPAPAPARAELELSVETMQQRLGPEAAGPLWNAGAALSLDEVLRLAQAPWTEPSG